MKPAQKKSAAARSGASGANSTNSTRNTDGKGAATASVPQVRDPAAAAIALVAHGWRVFPLRGKVPALKGVGLHQATDDKDQIKQWWPRGTKLSVGAVPPPSCYVVDVDSYKNPVKLQPLVDRLEALNTPLQRSGGGGLHALFRGPTPRPTDLRNAWGVSEGIDVKAHGMGYIVVAPSVHQETGAFYEWLPGKGPDVAPAGAPAWLASIFGDCDDRGLADMPTGQHKEALGIDMKAARELLDHLPFMWCDLYHDWVRAGMALHHEFGGDAEALALWDEWSQRNPNKYQEGLCAAKWETFGKPGKDEVTMRTLVRDAQATGWRAPDTIACAARDFDESGIARWLDAGRVGPFLDVPPPPVNWLFPGVTRYGKVQILAGAGGSSKSFFALTLAGHFVAGKSFGDTFVPMRLPDDEVLVLAGEEDKDDLHHRVWAAVQAADFDADQRAQVGQRMLVQSLLELDERETLAEYEHGGRGGVVEGNLLGRLRAALRIRPTIRWIIVDPLVLLHDLEENDNRAMAQLLGMLGKLARDAGVAIWLVHHLSKAGALADELNAQAMRGASAISDNARGVLMMQRLDARAAQGLGVAHDQAASIVRLSFAKNNYGPPRPDLYLRVLDSGAIEPLQVQPPPLSAAVRREVRKQAERDQATEYRDRACRIAVLRLLERGPLGKNAIYAAKPSGGRRVVERVLPGLVEEGLVRVDEGPQRKQLHHLTDSGRSELAKWDRTADYRV